VYEMSTKLFIRFLIAGSDHSVACESHAAVVTGGIAYKINNKVQ
jgi:hypothetical protein